MLNVEFLYDETLNPLSFFIDLGLPKITKAKLKIIFFNYTAELIDNYFCCRPVHISADLYTFKYIHS